MIEQLVCAVQEGRTEPVTLWLQLRWFILKIIKHYEGQAERDDLLQESYFALLSAVRLYDASQGNKFMTYFALWIKQRSIRYIDNCCRSVRLPAGQSVKVKQFNKLVSQFQRDLGRRPTDQEIEEALEVNADEIRFNDALLKVASLDTSAGENEDTPLAELVPDEETDIEAEVLEKVEREELSKKLWSLVDTLPENEAKTIRMRYQDGRTLRQCGDVLGVTTTRVSAIEETAIRRMRRNSEIEKQLQPYLDDYRYSKGIKSGRRRICGEDYSITEYAAIKALTYLEKLKEKGLISP